MESGNRQRGRSTPSSAWSSATTSDPTEGLAQVSTSTDGINTTQKFPGSEGFVGSGPVEDRRGASRGSSGSIDISRSAVDNRSADASGRDGHYVDGAEPRGQYQKSVAAGGGGKGDSSGSDPEHNHTLASGSTMAYHYGGGQMATEMEIEEVDVDDFCLDDELEHVADGRGIPRRVATNDNEARAGGGAGGQGLGWRAVTEIEATGVRELVFGDGSRAFNEAWREQGFSFCGVDGLGYGLVQAEGGPCGVLAVVQAFMLEVP